jgi:hypothetical protein
VLSLASASCWCKELHNSPVGQSRQCRRHRNWNIKWNHACTQARCGAGHLSSSKYLPHRSASIQLEILLLGRSLAADPLPSHSFQTRKNILSLLHPKPILNWRNACPRDLRIACHYRAVPRIWGIRFTLGISRRVRLEDQRAVVVWRLSSGRASGRRDLRFRAAKRAGGLRRATGRVSFTDWWLALPISLSFVLVAIRDIRLRSNWYGVDGRICPMFSAKILFGSRIYQRS